MLNIRRRSGSRIKELVNAPYRIDVASVHQETAGDKQEVGIKPAYNTEIRPTDVEAAQISPDKTNNAELENGYDLKDLKCQKGKSGTKLYLEQYIRFLHWVGLASFKEHWEKTTAPTYILHRALFLLLSTLTVLDAIKMIKISSTLSGSYAKMYRCVVAARFSFNGLKRIYFLVVVSSGSKQIIKMLDELHVLVGGWKSQSMKKVDVLVFGVGLLSFLAAILLPLLGWATIGQELDLSRCVLEKSFEMSLGVFVWTTNSTEISEKFAELYLYYATDFTAVTLSLGITGIVMEFLGSLLDYANNDLMFFSAMTMHKLSTEFQLKMEQRGSNLDSSLNKYRQLQKASTCIEEAFGRLFKISHVTNLFSCAYFVLILVSSKGYSVGMILLVLQILKVWVTYSLAAKSTTANKCFRELVRNSIIEGNLMEYDSKKTSALLESSTESPIGLGSETFFIDEIFLLKFATMVGTFSVFLIDSVKDFEAD